MNSKRYNNSRSYSILKQTKQSQIKTNAPKIAEISENLFNVFFISMFIFIFLYIFWTTQKNKKEIIKKAKNLNWKLPQIKPAKIKNKRANPKYKNW